MSFRGRTLDVGLGALAVAQLGVAAWLAPAGNSVSLDGKSVGSTCLSHELLGIDCPFCGMTRSFVALAHGQIGKAFELHPAGPLLFLAMVVFVFAVAYVTARRLQPLVERKRFMFAFQTIALMSLVIGVFKLVRS